MCAETGEAADLPKCALSSRLVAVVVAALAEKTNTGSAGRQLTGQILLHPGNYRFFAKFSNFVIDPMFVKNASKS